MTNTKSDLLSFITGNSSRILSLQNNSVPVELLSVKEASGDSEKISQAIGVLNQQRDLIRGLQSAHLQCAKIAAALTEACKLAQDGAIDVEDVVEHARRLLKTGSVKLSAVDEEFSQTPGDVISAETDGESSSSTDVLTQTLRSL
jgi:hypothetical protein